MIGRFLFAVVLALVLSLVVRVDPVMTPAPASLETPKYAAPGDVVAEIPRALFAAPTATPHPARPPLDADSTVLAYPPPPLNARAAVLIDLHTGQTLLAKNPDERLPMASTTKITTAILALERSHLNELVRVSRQAAAIGESTMALQQGERVTVKQLLYGLMLNSGNDAAIALAEHTAGSVHRFVRMMNSLAQALGMRNTHYVTPHGLDEPGHYSSARDLATVARYAMRDPMFRRIVSTESYYVPKTRHNAVHYLASVNQVMYWYPGVNGVKPGDTDNAGLCQVVSVDRDGRQLIAVLLNTPTLVNDIRNLLNFGLKDFRWIQAPAWWDSPANAVTGGSPDDGWAYYYGAGHYVRGAFLHYFRTHGGLQTLGYPRTEAIDVGGTLMQFFQGGELAYDPSHRTAYPIDLGARIGRSFGGKAGAGQTRPAPAFRSFYRQLGGRGVLGEPVTGMARQFGFPVQFFDYGELLLANGAPMVVPLGDIDLRLRGWLPANGAADSFPPDFVGAFSARFPGPPRVHLTARRAVAANTGRSGIRPYT